MILGKNTVHQKWKRLHPFKVNHKYNFVDPERQRLIPKRSKGYGPVRKNGETSDKQGQSMNISRILSSRIHLAKEFARYQKFPKINQCECLNYLQIKCISVLLSF